MQIEITFQGPPGGQRDTLACDIIEKHGGTQISAGTFLPTMERDIQCEVPNDKYRACLEELRNRGFKAVPEFLE